MSKAPHLQSVKSVTRLAPPDHLTDRQRELWSEIVNSLPADFFRPGDVPLLVAYCKSWSFYLEAAENLEDNGIVLRDPRGRDYANPAQSLLTTQASAMAQLAVKLRLAPSSRIQPRTAGSKSARVSAPRPWEREDVG